MTQTRPEDPAETARWEAEKLADRLRDEIRAGHLEVLPADPLAAWPHYSLAYIAPGRHGSTAIYRLDGDMLDVSHIPARDRVLAAALLRYALGRLEGS